MKLKVQIPRPFKGFLQPYRYKIAYGGRGSAKSWTIANLLVLMSYQKPMRILCARELQLSIGESVHKLICDCIERNGLNQSFTIEKATIYGSNGSQFIFSGIKNNVTKIKSMEGIDIVWVEEAEAVSADSWNVLIPTIRKPNSEIWVSFNPANILDDTYKRFVVNPPENSYVVKVNYADNPWFPDVLRLEKDSMKENDEEMYRHVWLGEPVADTALAVIKPAWISAAIDAHVKLGIEPTGGKIMGFDVSDEGADKNAYIWRHGVVVMGIDEWKDIDPASAAQHCYTTCLENSIELLRYDNIGVGAGAKGELRQEEARMISGGARGVVRVRSEGFNAAASVHKPESDYLAGKKNKDMFYNLKAQAWWLIADRFRNTYNAVNGKPYDKDNIICIPASLPHIEKLCAELSQPRREYLNGKIKIESKADMKKRGVSSPNLADAMVMAFAPETNFDISVLL